MIMPMQQNKIYLASKSPRRRELLRQIGVEFDLLLCREAIPRGPDVTEEVLPNEAAVDYVQRVTQEKAIVASAFMHMRRLPVRPVLAADTTVVVDQKILGKPADFDEAVNMMSQLSGRTHQVLTGIAVHHMHDNFHILQTSEVTFSKLTPEEIVAYCRTQEPYDKAGGYGIQGLAARYIQHISGSYSGIMGLPLYETCALLKSTGIHLS